MTKEEITKEEAVKRLKEARSTIQPIQYVDEAIDYAIKLIEQEPILDKIKNEIEQTEINGHIRDVECFRAGIDVALNIIDKYKAEGSEKS